MDQENLDDSPRVMAYCHPDEVAKAQSIIDLSSDKEAVVTPHQCIRKGEIILYSPTDLEFKFELPPYFAAHRYMMEEIEKSETTIVDMIRMRNELAVGYRLPLKSVLY